MNLEEQLYKPYGMGFHIYQLIHPLFLAVATAEASYGRKVGLYPLPIFHLAQKATTWLIQRSDAVVGSLGACIEWMQ